MKDIFPFHMFKFLEEYDCGYFIYSIDKGNFQDPIVKNELKYCPGVYLVYDYSTNSLGDILYCGKAGADKKGYINKHQLPKRLLATCNLPINYPPLNGKIKDITRDKAWVHMMRFDNISSIIVFYFYTPVVEIDGELKAEPTPLVIEEKIHNIFKEEGVNRFKWSTKQV